MTLTFPVESFSVLRSLLLIILHIIHTEPLDGNGGHQCLGSPQSYDQLFSLCHIQLQMVLQVGADRQTGGGSMNSLTLCLCCSRMSLSMVFVMWEVSATSL